MQHLYSEIYNLEAMVDEYNNIRSRLQHITWLQIVVIALMFWSNSTYSSCSIWQCFALADLHVFWQHLKVHLQQALIVFSSSHGLSAKITLSLSQKCTLILTMLQFSNGDFETWYLGVTGGSKASDNVKCYVKQSIFHAAWLLLLDAWFHNVYINGTVVWFSNGFERLVLPWIFIYSDNYSEKCAPWPTSLHQSDQKHSGY
jgi:hypothetical protein